MRESATHLIRPPRLKKGDTLGIITPGSGYSNSGDIREGIENLQSLGFKVKSGQHIRERYGYLAGADDQRLSDLHAMFADPEVNGIITLRGGYGTMRILERIDYKLIKQNPKILIGYSDITALNMGIHAITGLVTFHGPVATSTFTAYTRHYFEATLMSNTKTGTIEHPDPGDTLHPTSRFNTLHGGKASGPLVGGNLTLMTALLGTPFDCDTKGKIVFIEEVGEEPYAIDRMLTQLLLAQKLQHAAGIVIDSCDKCGVSDYKPSFNNSLGVEEVFEDRLSSLNLPIVFGFSIGHTADKPTLPLGVTATLDADKRTLSIDEPAVS
ncbi:LD-carboxypeptidase [candidate division KSB1 bacterium]|nr:LD-carboxypeptidase [candidate division KSB1 bacterium]